MKGVDDWWDGLERGFGWVVLVVDRGGRYELGFVGYSGEGGRERGMLATCHHRRAGSSRSYVYEAECICATLHRSEMPSNRQLPIHIPHPPSIRQLSAHPPPPAASDNLVNPPAGGLNQFRSSYTLSPSIT